MKLFSDSLNLRYTLLATGRFITMIPASVLLLGPKRTALKVLPTAIPRWQWPTSVVTLKNRTLSPLAQRFIECVCEVAKPLAKRQ